MSNVTPGHEIGSGKMLICVVVSWIQPLPAPLCMYFRVDVTLRMTLLAASKSSHWHSNSDFLFNYNYGT